MNEERQRAVMERLKAECPESWEILFGEGAMSDVCPKCGEVHATIHINRAQFRKYIVRVRRQGHRKYEIVGRTNTKPKAFRMLGSAMAKGNYKRGDVLGDEGPESYYEPTRLVEMVR